MLTRVLILCSAAGLAIPPALATPPSVPTDQAQIIEMVAAALGGAKPGAGPTAPELPPFDEVTKGMKSTDGFFTLWSYPSDAKDKDQERLLCQIPASVLGEKFMLSTSFSGGGFLTGFPLEEHVVKWELLDKQLLLIRPETHYVLDDKQTVSDVVRRTYPEKIRASVPILTKSPKGDPVIDLGALLKSDFADIGWTVGIFGGGPPMPAMVNAALSKWTKKKTFLLNTEIGVELALAQPSPPGSFEKKQVHFSFWKLPKTDYAARPADDRVGYFLTANRDWGKPTSARDIFNRYVDRWHLVKRDSSLAMCEPVQPIVFYVEKTVPVKFRRAVRDGIVEWNKAFEKIGFVNAVEVRQQTDDNEWRDLDPEDMRYSFFRWIVTGAGFAMGPHRANPFSGQIYDADIIFDDSMVRYYEQEAQQMLPSALPAMKFNDLALRDFVAKFPQFAPPQSTWEGYQLGGNDAALRERMLERMKQHGDHFCDYAHGMKHQVAFASAALAGQPQEVIDKLLYDVVKEVVMHEVGHTLGLRHNFKASSIWSVEEIKRRRAAGEATTGSVMDYNPVLFFGDKTALEGEFVTPTIGPYDYWAIEYGYRGVDGSAPTTSAGDQKDEQKEKAKPEQKADGKPAAGEAKVVAAAADNIPKEILDQLPPEVKKAIESGAIAALAAEGGHAGKESTSAPIAAPSANPAEVAMLNQIAGRAAEPDLAYASDEDTTYLGPDPRSNRFDMGRNPVEWAKARVELIDQRMDNLLQWGVKDGESWYHLRQAFFSLLYEKAFVYDYVGRYIGGQYTSRSHRGDPDAAPPFELVPAEQQREALKFITDSLYSDKFFAFSPEVLNHLTMPRWWHEGAYVDFRVDFPAHQVISMLQWWNLFDRLFPNTLRRIHDAELKNPSADRLTAAEYVQAIKKACWSGLDPAKAKSGTFSDSAPFITDVRRSLQREYLSLVEPLVRTPPGQIISPDLHGMVQHSLRTLNNQIKETVATGKLDFASEAHLAACQSRIERMLAPELNEYRVSMGPTGF